MIEQFKSRGWLRFAADPAIADWVRHALPVARHAVADPAMAHWLQCEGTWFVGVDALPNDAQGRIGGSSPLSGRALDFVRAHVGPIPPLHRAQVSVTYPGYPRPRAGERESAFRYRLKRDAAHVDGLLAVGADRRRMLREPHAFILGIPLTGADADAAPLVVWEGSHQIMQTAFRDAFAEQDRNVWPDLDVTDIYQATRRTVFERCRRVEIPAAPGEAILLHRHALHGVAPWGDGARADPDGRMIAYFRPEFPAGIADWLTKP